MRSRSSRRDSSSPSLALVACATSRSRVSEVVARWVRRHSPEPMEMMSPAAMKAATVNQETVRSAASGVFAGDKRVLIVDAAFGDLAASTIPTMVVVIVTAAVAHHDAAPSSSQQTCQGDERNSVTDR